MRTFLKNTLMLAIVAFAAIAATAQTPARGERPYDVGEVLTYDGKISKIISGISVAELKFAVEKAPDSDDLLFKTEAVSKGTLLKIFRFSFLQQYESLVDRESFRILKTTKHDVQKERVRDGLAVFDYKENRVKYTETDPKDPNRPPRRIASTLDGQVFDMISGIYAIRAMPLEVGRSFEMKISDSGLVYSIPVRVTAREQQKSSIGRRWCYRVEPIIFGRGRLIEQKGGMIIWFTDDERRIPVRSRIDTEFGRIEVRIRSVSPTL